MLFAARFHFALQYEGFSREQQRAGLREAASALSH
jgi:hypothetical protein